MKNYVSDGKTVVVTAGAAITSGDIVRSNEVVGIAANDAANGESVVLVIEGVFRVAKNTSTAINVGDLVDYDSSVPEVTVGLTPAAGDVTNFAIAMETVLAAATTVAIKLKPGDGAFS